MTQQEVLTSIQTWIVANSNNEITADVLRPILEDILAQPNTVTGQLANLSTQDSTNLVNAINEVLQVANLSTGIVIHSGTVDPNLTAPPAYDLGDFYQWLSQGSLLAFFQYNGSRWVEVKAPSVAMHKRIVRPTQTYTVQADDYTIVFDPTQADSTNGVTLSLPAAAQNRFRVLRIVNRTQVAIGLNVQVRVLTGSASTFLPYNKVSELQSDGNDWQLINNAFS